jgi:hypothetical protein
MMRGHAIAAACGQLRRLVGDKPPALRPEAVVPLTLHHG